MKFKDLPNDKKIEILTRKLLKELESQGYSLKSTNEMYGVDINIEISRKRLYLANILSRWEIECGAYNPKFENDAEDDSI